MNVKELYYLLEEAMSKGYAESPIYFDTEARSYSYHMAKVSKAFIEDFGGNDLDNQEVWIILHEESNK